MNRFFVALTIGMSLFFSVGACAQTSHGGLLDRLLAIAEPDQVEAYHQLDLSPQQLEELRGVAAEMLPRVERSPSGAFMLVPETLAKVDGILTPAQRPLARRLVPRSHQWVKLKELYQDYR